MIGKQISHYHILEKLGEGGMGVVYKAEDTKLKRTVALKFLPRGLEAHEPERARLLQEAQAAATLNHPNICTIHDISEYQEQQFIVMEYVDGQTLRKMVPIPKFQDALDYAIQIGEALQEAHSKGVVHRDIKTDNIMVNSRNQVKVMDFGLAKLKGSLKLTKTSSTVGTLAYMAPEQIQGREVDARSDIFSFGVVLYEMLTGKLPFRGDYEAAILYSILNEEPQLLSHYRTDIPSPCVTVITKALQKDPARRYQKLQEMIFGLKNIPAIHQTMPAKSIVVLPFDNLSPDPDQEYFSDGLTEEVISDLSAIRSLRVISRSSAMTFKGTKKKVPEIAMELNVQYVLEGSVRKAANNLRITAQLIDAMNDTHLWAEKYAGTLEDIFDVQEKVSRSIVEALKLKLTPEESRKISERPIENVEAYQCYLKANADIMRFSKSSLDNACLNLQRGLDILGDNALLYASMAFVYWQYANIGAGQEEYITKAEEYVRKSLALDPDSPQAHTIQAMIGGAFYGNLQEGIRQLKKALALNPNEVTALKWLTGTLIVSIGKLSAAVPFMLRLKEIDPLEPWNWLLQGFFHLFDGQYLLASISLRHYYELNTDNPEAQFFYAWSLIYENRYDEAFSIIDRSAKINPDNAVTKFGLLMKYAKLGDREQALKEITPDFRKTCERDHQWSYFIALPLALLDEREKSLDWLENAIEKGFLNYPELARNPSLTNLRSEQQFRKLLEGVKYKWEHFEVPE